jgi:Ca-activated chloride channel homolog
MKWYKKIFFCLGILIPSVSVCFFSYDRAALAAQNNAFDDAKSMITALLVDHPDKPDLLYDAGVLSYKTKDYDQAAAYFQHAAEHSESDPALKERAYFNEGNTYVAQRKLAAALEAYEQALHINPANERTIHNRDIVKKMLEQQEKQEQQDKQKQEQKKEQENEQSSQQDHSADEQKSQSNQESDTQKNQQQRNDSQQQADEKGETGSQHDEQRENAEEKNESERSEQEQNNTSDSSEQNNTQKRNNQQDSSALPEQQQQDKKREEPRDKGKNKRPHNDERQPREPQQMDAQKTGDQKKQHHEQPSLGSEADDTRTKEESKAQPAAAHHEEPDTPERHLDEQLAYILQQYDKHDADLHKQMIKATVGKQLAGTHGQNCW